MAEQGKNRRNTVVFRGFLTQFGRKSAISDRIRFGYGHLNRIVWAAQASPRLASGMVDGYFDGDVPQEFWRLLAPYISSNTLGSLPWGIPFGAEQVAVFQKQAQDILRWYDNMQNVIPSWYR